MPYTSRKQQGYFHANVGKNGITPEMVDEYDQASKGLSLPRVAPKSASPKKVGPKKPRPKPRTKPRMKRKVNFASAMKSGPSKMGGYTAA